ncbi:hypothetical protein JCM1841_000733 [Sporobolomyces salmonicolor]
MSVDSLPPHAWFAAPEGVYTLVSTLNIPPTTGPNSAAAHFASPPQPTTPALGAAPPSNQPAPPPTYPAKLAVVAVRFPVKEGGTGLGLGMSMGRRGGKDMEGAASGLGAAPSGGGAGDTAGAGQDPAGLGSGGAAGPSGSFSPLMKRRPLTSSFSMLGGLNMAGGGDAITTSRPARAFKGTSSSFVRSWEGLPLSQVQLKAIAEGNVGKDTIFGFQTIGKAVVWNEIGKGKKDLLSRIVFSSFPTCIDANKHTASHNQIDLLVGFASGDIVWMDPLTARYSRLNKSGVITSSAVTSILWLPPSPPASSSVSAPSTSSYPENRSNLFITSHADGTMLLWDKDREDWNGFVPSSAPRHLSGARGKENEWGALHVAPGEEGKAARGMEDLVISKPPAVDKKGQSTAKFNPVSHWRVSRKAINAFAISPDLQLCAAVGEDGCLRIIDIVEEKLLDTFSSYFGSLNCVAWSPDGRFVVTGGQDDLLTVYAPLEQHIVAHCPGHSSWVTGVAWDPWRSEERTMRFASIGEDCKLSLWDLSSAALTRPKAHAHPHVRRHSHSSQLSLRRHSDSESASQLPIDSPERFGPTFHPAPRRDDVSVLQPVMVKTLATDLFSSLTFLPEYIILGTRGGQVKQYDRPPVEEGLLGLSNEFAASVVRIDARAR